MVVNWRYYVLPIRDLHYVQITHKEMLSFYTKILDAHNFYDNRFWAPTFKILAKTMLTIFDDQYQYIWY